MKVRIAPEVGTGGQPAALLVLEPKDGGDLQVIGEVTEVDQLKSKSDQGTWSLQTIVRDVLPDLFLATEVDDGSRRYRFITEGRMGRWSGAYDFFNRLGKSEPPADVLTGLGDKLEVKFQHSTTPTGDEEKEPFFPAESYTERTLFLRIADALLARPAIAKLKLDQNELHRRLWRLLGGFQFVANQSVESVKHNIDQLLKVVVDRADDISKVRNSLAVSLLEKATKGNAEVTVEALFREHGLNATPLTEWHEIRLKAERELRRLLRLRRYSEQYDVRTSTATSVATNWKDSVRVLVISGESGQGKTWLLAATALAALSDEAPVVWTDATGHSKEDLQSAADQFWLDIRGGESSLPLRQIAARLNSVVLTPGNHRLRVCLDNVADYKEAAAIIRDDWPSQGVSIAMSCPSHVANSLAEAFGDQVELVSCQDFSWEELHDYLKRKLGSDWTAVPEDIREPLRRPLLASIYSDELFEERWTATNEYELFSAIWKRLSTRQQSTSPLDAAVMEKLAGMVLAGEPYPWTLQQLLGDGIDNQALVRLEQCGWLVRVEDGRVRVFHDRLLNWAAAQFLFSSIRSGTRTAEDVVTEVAQLNTGSAQIGNVHLGYVPMDLLWLVAGDNDIPAEVGAKLISALEPTFRHLPEILYKELLPTLGDRIVKPLCALYRDFQGRAWLRTAIAKAIAATRSEEICRFANQLLSDADPHQQRRGLQLLRHASCPQFIEQIWRLHIRAGQEPALFLEENEKDWLLREDTWGALKNAVAGQSAWLRNRIEKADPATEPLQDLASLIAIHNDGADIWKATKALLLTKLSPDRIRILAKCMGRFRDDECLPWLKEKLSEKQHLLAPMVLQALSRISPDEAVEALPQGDFKELHYTTSWCFDEVWHRRPAAVNAKMCEWAESVDDSWDVGFLYRDRVNSLPVPLFELLLDHFSKRLGDYLKSSVESDGFAFYRELDFLVKAVSPKYLDHLAGRKGTELETNLKEYVQRVGPQRGQWFNGHERVPALSLLRRINGDAFTQLVNEFLRCDDRLGRHEAIDWAIRRPDAETFSRAVDIVNSDGLWEHFPIEQNDAMQLLALHGQWESAAKGIVRWGLQTQIDMTEARLVPSGFSAPWLDEIREEVQRAATPGSIMALAFAGSDADAQILHGILEEASLGSDLALACICGLDMLEDKSARGVALVSRHLSVEKHHYPATRMLTQVGTPAAWEAIWNDLQVQFDHINALNLLNNSPYGVEVSEIVVSQLPSQSHFGNWELLKVLIQELRQPELKERILADRWLRDSFHRQATAAEGRTWVTGSKATAIECLAELDPEAAFDAALRALLTPSAHDREMYPYILVELDKSRGTAVLLDQLVIEEAEEVRYAIGRIFSTMEMKDELSTRLKSDRAEVRSSACFAAGWAKDGQSFASEMENLVNDCDEAAMREAMNALDRLRDRAICTELTTRTVAASDIVTKWLYLDALLEVIDPGDEGQLWPVELRRACDGLSPIILNDVAKRLKKRRKKLDDDFRKKSRRA